MKLKPLNDRVLVKRLESEEKTAGGLGKFDEQGKRIPMTVQPGNEVLFNKYAGTEVKLDNVDHLVMREEDILAIIE